MKECTRCLMTDDIMGVVIGEDGQCNFCKIHDELNAKYPISAAAENALISKIKRQGKGKKYDCLLGISGGSDSSYLMHWAHEAGLRVLTFHIDNGFNSDEAEHNMKIMLRATGFDHVRFIINHKQFCELSKAFLLAGVSDTDIPNDISAMKMTLEITKKFGIKTILNGHSFRAEGIVPIGWTYMDAKYIKSVAKAYDVDITGFPLMTIADQIKGMFYGIQHVRPLYNMFHTKEYCMGFLESNYGWKRYTGRHCENKYTAFAGWVIYDWYGIDKRRIELSAQIRSGYITKDKAKEVIAEKAVPSGFDLIEMFHYMKVPPWLWNAKQRCRDMFYDFPTYHDLFIRYRPFFWLLTKMKLFPETFYKKYTVKYEDRSRYAR